MRYTTRFTSALLFFLVSVIPVVYAQTSGDVLSDKDRENIRSTIQAQLDAFQADDADKAFSFATPEIQNRFGDPTRFMAMVVSSYQPVYRPKAVFFKEIVQKDGITLQQVLLIDGNDQSIMAYYPMQLQSDGSWRIDGCYLAPTTQSQML